MYVALQSTTNRFNRYFILEKKESLRIPEHMSMVTIIFNY